MTGAARVSVAAAAAACALAVVPVAQAGVPRTPFNVTPATASTSSPITASWKVDRRLKRGESFGFELSIVPAGTDGTTWGDFHGYNCTTNFTMRGRVVRKGGTLRVTFRPGGGRHKGIALEESWPTWCPGTARIQLVRYPFEDNTSISRMLGLRKVPITLAPGETIPFPQPAVKVTLLAGSTITATAAGRPDRSTPVTGVLRGILDVPIAPVTHQDVKVSGLAGALKPASFAPDPLCPGTTPPATFDVSGSRLDAAVRGPVTFALNLNGAPSQIFGCGPPGALAGTTSLKLTGTYDLRTTGLGSMTLAGSAPGFALPDGTQGGLAASLVVNVDLSGRP